MVIGSDGYYVLDKQLSRATSLDHVFIMRPFNGEDLHVPLSQQLQDELHWQQNMAVYTRERYSNSGALGRS